MSSLPGLRQLMILAVALGAAAGCAHAEPGREVLRSLDVEGNETLSSSEIEQRLALAETPVWPWSDYQYYDQGTLTGDRRRLLRYYQANGFYEARVKSRVKRSDGDARVTFVITEGPASLVERLEIVGIDELPAAVRTAVFRDPLPLREGLRITEAAWDETQRALVQRLRDHGYGDVEVEGTVQVDVAAGVATAVARVRPGRRLRFGRVVITGPVAVPRKTILDSVRADIPEGSRFSDERLARAEGNLLAMGVFSGVRVSRGPANAEDDTVPLLVAVREAPFETVRAGVGVGIETGRFSARATGDYTHRNFLGGLRTLRFENELGYALMRDGAQVGEHGVVGGSALDFTQPNLIRSLDTNVRVSYEHGIEFLYRFDAVKGRVGFPIRLHRSLTFTPSYNLQRFWLHKNDGVSTSGGEGGNCELEAGDCVLAYLEERIAWDRRDNPLETTSGWYGALSLQQGRSWLGSQSSYDRVLGELRYFQPLPWNWVLALKVEGGALFPLAGQGSPIMERFYAGGSNSVRGFGYNQLSPQVQDAGTTGPIGGDALLEGSAELRIPLAGSLGMALFVDAGNVTRDASADASQLVRPNVAIGTGLRYKTPFGPVRLDLGYLAVKNLPCVVEAGACSDAPIDVSPFAFHFSIGEAF